MPESLRPAACVLCRYPLHGLERTDDCPECGCPCLSPHPCLFGWMVSDASLPWRRLIAAIAIFGIFLALLPLARVFPEPAFKFLLLAAGLSIFAAADLILRLLICGRTRPDTLIELGPDHVRYLARHAEEQCIPWGHVRHASVCRLAPSLYALRVTSLYSLRVTRTDGTAPLSAVFRASQDEATSLRRAVRSRLSPAAASAG